MAASTQSRKPSLTMRSLRDSMAHTIQALVPTVHRVLDRAVASGETIDLVQLLNRFMMEAFTKIGFGIDLYGIDAAHDHPFMAAFDNAQRLVVLRFIRPRILWKLLQRCQLGSEAELTKNVRVIDDTVLSIIARSLAEHHSDGRDHETNPTILSLFLADAIRESERTGTPVDPTSLRDVVVNFLIVGRDTTAQALSWFFYELSRNPHVEEKIRKELQQHQSAWKETAPSTEDVQHHVCLEATLKETLRLYPSVPSNSRQSNRDTVLCDGTFIPKGTIVSFIPYAIVRSTHVWGPDAKTFRPERWIDPQHPEKLITVSAFQFNSFHAGPRMCLSMNLAMMEMKIFVASVLSKFRFDVVSDQHITYNLSLTLPVKGSFLTRLQCL